MNGDVVPAAGRSSPLIVVMGVSGSGKTTIGELLSARFGVPFEDADYLHSKANLEKMEAGYPLTDDDRWPWLARVGTVLSNAAETGLVMACSALKRSYRDAILAEEPRARFIYLEASRSLLESRLLRRSGHFMPTSLLDSQLETLEPLASEEPGMTVSVDQPPESIVDAVAAGTHPPLRPSL
ncbi:MAG: transferase [Hymenobacter sp.]|nr:transferase [Hymenobacter sp.]